MKNICIKFSYAIISSVSVITAAYATTPTGVPEPATFGMFAGAVAVAIIMARIIKKK